MKTLALLSVFLALPLAAQNTNAKALVPKCAGGAPPTPCVDMPEPETSPVLSPDLLKEYYKALAHQIEATAAKNTADQALNQRIAEIKTICGDSVDLKPDGEPQCKPKAKPSEKQ